MCVGAAAYPRTVEHLLPALVFVGRTGIRWAAAFAHYNAICAARNMPVLYHHHSTTGGSKRAHNRIKTKGGMMNPWRRYSWESTLAALLIFEILAFGLINPRLLDINVLTF